MLEATKNTSPLSDNSASELSTRRLGGIMEILRDHAQQNGYARQVVVPSRVLAALSQLEATEQAGVRALFDAVARQGVDDAAGVGVRTLDAPTRSMSSLPPWRRMSSSLHRCSRTRPLRSRTSCGQRRCAISSMPLDSSATIRQAGYQCDDAARHRPG